MVNRRPIMRLPWQRMLEHLVRLETWLPKRRPTMLDRWQFKIHLQPRWCRMLEWQNPKFPLQHWGNRLPRRFTVRERPMQVWLRLLETMISLNLSFYFNLVHLPFKPVKCTRGKTVTNKFMLQFKKEKLTILLQLILQTINWFNFYSGHLSSRWYFLIIR